MNTTAPIAYDQRYAFYLDANNGIHPIGPGHLDRLHRGESNATLPQMAGHHVRFAVLYVERFTSPPRIVIDSFPLLSFDTEGRVDQQHHYDASKPNSTNSRPTTTPHRRRPLPPHRHPPHPRPAGLPTLSPAVAS